MGRFVCADKGMQPLGTRLAGSKTVGFVRCCLKMEASKLLRTRRSSQNRKKRKQNEKSANAKRRRNRRARIAAAQSSPSRLEEAAVQELPTQHPDSQGDATRHKVNETPTKTTALNKSAERYHRHALYFYSKWTKAEQGNLPIIEERSINELQTEIGRGRFGICSLAKYGARTVVVKKQNDIETSKHEARMTAKLSHPNVACLIGIIERINNRVDIVTNFYSVNGDHMNLCEIPAGNENINWMHLLRGLCDGLRYLHDKEKILHNVIKSNNVVLDGGNLAEADAVLVDFGKATYQTSPKIYKMPADTQKFKHLAPELGKENGKQSKKSDIYSFGFMIRGLKYKFPNFPSRLVNLYRSCLHSSPLCRPSASNLCERVSHNYNYSCDTFLYFKFNFITGLANSPFISAVYFFHLVFSELIFPVWSKRLLFANKRNNITRI